MGRLSWERLETEGEKDEQTEDLVQVGVVHWFRIRSDSQAFVPGGSDGKEKDCGPDG
jgi:hypothetical protein